MAVTGKGQEAIQLKITSTGSREMRRSLGSIVREGLNRLCALYGRDVNPAWPVIWEQAVADLEPRVLEAAFLKLERTFEPTAAAPFPAPAHLRKLVESARSLSVQDDAENAWHEFLTAIETQYHPDLGWRGPRLTPKIDHAARAAGGVHAVWNMSNADRVWAKKRFIECYLRDEQLGEVEGLLLPSKEMAKVLQPLSERKQLPDASPKPLGLRKAVR